MLYKTSVKEPGLCFQKWLCLRDTWRPAAFQYADFFSWDLSQTAMENGRTNSVFGQQKLRWDVSPSRQLRLPGRTAQGFPAWTLTQPCSCADAILFTFNFLHSLYSALNCTHTWVHLHFHSSHCCTPELVSWVAAVSNAAYGWATALTHSAQQQHYPAHRVNSDHKPFWNHLIFLPFYKMQIKKIMKH